MQFDGYVITFLRNKWKTRNHESETCHTHPFFSLMVLLNWNFFVAQVVDLPIYCETCVLWQFTMAVVWRYRAIYKRKWLNFCLKTFKTEHFVPWNLSWIFFFPPTVKKFLTSKLYWNNSKNHSFTVFLLLKKKAPRIHKDDQKKSCWPTLPSVRNDIKCQVCKTFLSPESTKRC